jgi:hypothetical protein
MIPVCVDKEADADIGTYTTYMKKTKKIKGAEKVALVFGGIAIAAVVIISSGTVGINADAAQTAAVGSFSVGK